MSLLEIYIPNSDDVDRKFKVLSGMLLDPTTILDEAAALLLNRIRTNFLRQTAPDGTKWIESAAARYRDETGRGGGTLFDSGDLFHSIQLFSVSPTERSIASDVPYGPHHNFGEGQELREFMGFAELDGQLAERLVLKRFQEALK